MSSALFMRGMLDLTDSAAKYYLIGLDASGAYYIYQAPPTGSGNTDARTYSVFASTDYSNGGVIPHPVSLRSSGAGYVLSAPISSDGGPVDLSLTSYNGAANVMEGSSTGTPGTVITLTSEAKLPTNTLWSGVWYTVRSGNTPVRWKYLDAAAGTGPFRGVNGDANPASVGNFAVMLIPTGLSVWNQGSCRIPDQPDAGLLLFSSWAKGDSNAPTNCDGPGWLAGAKTNLETANNCIFASATACNQRYLYTLCGPGSNCGNCLGACADTTQPCTFDYDPTLPAQDQSPYSCTPTNPTPPSLWEQYRWYIIGALIILVIIISLVILFIVLSRRKPAAVARLPFQLR